MGLTLVEAVVLLAILAVLIALTAFVFRPAPAPGAARELARALRTARWTAVTTGRAIVLLTSDHGGSVVAVDDGTWTCSVDGVIRPVWHVGERRLVLTWPVRGIAFGPDGFPRSCHGDGVGSATAVLADGGVRAAVVVSSLGRVRWELRP